MSFAKVLMKDFCILRGCLTYKLILGIRAGQENVLSNSRILLRNLADDSHLTIPKPISSNKILTFYQRKDRIPGGFKLIYRVKNNFSFSAAHCCVLLTTFSFSAISVVLAVKNNFRFPMKVSEIIVIRNWFEVFAFVCLTFGLVASILILVSRFPFRIYHNKNTNEYIAAYSNILLPWRTTNLMFKKGQVSIIPEEQLWIVQWSKYKINENKVILVEEHFERPADLEGMFSKKDTR